MNKVAHYLQEHVVGEVMTSTAARKYFSTDNSIFTLTPSVIVYPKNENDVRKTARFTWQLAERNRIIPITARGSGTDLSGAALGAGIVMVYPAHLNHVQYFEPKDGVISVEAGINFGKLQQLLLTYGRFLPPAPASLEYSTVGGAVANNASSMRSFKYGDTRSYVRSLRIVLANGEVIETGKLSKKELNRKLGLTTFEGEIYRSVDTLLEENKELIDKSFIDVTKNVAGYDLIDIKQEDGSFDLTPLFVGSQGTLGLITEVTLDTEFSPDNTTLIVAYLDSVEVVQSAILDLRKLHDSPSAIELVDDNLLSYVSSINGNYLKDIIAPPYPKFVLLIEVANEKDHKHKKLVKSIQKTLTKLTQNIIVEEDLEKQKMIWKLRDASSLLSAHNEGRLSPIPLIDDGIVPAAKIGALMKFIYSQFAKEHLQVALWGHAGDGNLHVQPYLNLAQVGDRQKAFRMLEDFHQKLRELGGSTTAQYNDGRLRGPYLDKLYTDDVYKLFQKIKTIFDPYGTLNPGVKINVSLDEVRPLVRSDYGIDHIYDHLPLS
jgi:FAD/FMN-containing dehydrogenase